ncbi:MAG TPA: hypothetical protein VF846_21400 [Thermoanaerobaculia bacterium]
MVLWSIKVMELDCQMKKPCEAPPLTAKEFKRTFDAHKKEQVVAFNEGLHWALLAYGDARGEAWFLSGRAEEFLTRANVLNAALLGTGEGAWGQVISMGNGWDGAINVQCGGVSGKIMPRFNYVVPVTGRNGEREIDWWVSRAGNAVYDEVHFAKEWKVYHYYLPDAKVGSCTVAEQLPGKGIMPWVQPGTSVMRVRTSDQREITFGSFLAIQRAGGTYAMASGGQWRRAKEPISSDEGTTANVKNARYDWTIDTNGRLPHAAILFDGRGEYRLAAGGGGRVRKYAQIYLYNDKKIYFPQDRQVKLGLVQGGDCAKTCRNGLTRDGFILDYDVENGADSTLKAVAAVFLYPEVKDPTRFNPAAEAHALGNGVVVNGSYESTKERRQKTVNSVAIGPVATKPDTAYRLQYLLNFDISTEGAGINATEWAYRAKITPAMLYVTK